MSELIKSVTDTSFDTEVIQATNLVLVDFWAEWCGPCKMIAPVLEQVAAELGAKIKIVKVNVDNSPESAARYGVRSIPNLVLFKNGVEVGNKTGSMTKSQLIAFINEYS